MKGIKLHKVWNAAEGRFGIECERQDNPKRHKWKRVDQEGQDEVCASV